MLKTKMPFPPQWQPGYRGFLIRCLARGSAGARREEDPSLRKQLGPQGNPEAKPQQGGSNVSEQLLEGLWNGHGNHLQDNK